MIYRLIVSYVGTPFAGWQRQRNALAVQQVLETGLGRVVGVPVVVVGASRTDAGVHARAQAAHLVLEQPLPPPALVHATNQFLPAEVRVLRADRMPLGFHARKHAAGKTYRYRLTRERVVSPLDAPFVLRVPAGLDLEAMAEAAAWLCGRHDFSAFAAAGGSHVCAERTISSASWQELGAELSLTLVGDGFLRGMVRAVVGTLLEVGRGRRTIDDFAQLLAGGARAAAGPSAPAHGLVLEEVHYAPPWRDGEPDPG